MDKYFSEALAKRALEAENKHPVFCYGSLPLAATILMEEVGEVCRAILEEDSARVREELLDVAAVCQRAWEMLQTRDDAEKPGLTFP